MSYSSPYLEFPALDSSSTGWLWSGNVLPITTTNTCYPSISVVTPSFNQGEFLGETIRSVISQGYPNLEYIVMDGGSTDGSVEIIKKHEPWLSHWQSQPDGGQYDAVQKGFERSHGEIMAYLNSDDLYLPWTFKVVADIFALFPQVEWLTTSYTAAASSDSRFSFGGQIYNRSRRWFYGNRGMDLLTSGFIPQEATFWRRTLWEKAGSKLDTSLTYAGDFELWARFFEHTNVVIVNMPLAVFRYHGGQKTKQLQQYVNEANLVLNRYSKPIQLPRIILRVLNRIFRTSILKNNWLGTRCDKIDFHSSEDCWQYAESLAC